MYQWKYWEIPNDIGFLDFRKSHPHRVDKFNHPIESEYYQGWESAYIYAYQVLSGERNASRYEIAMVERFIHDTLREDLTFDRDEIELVLTVANELRHPKGALGGTRFFLMRWMVFVMANVFGFFYAKTDNVPEDIRGHRRFQKSNVFVARGNSKTVLSAVIAIVNTIFTENMSPICTTSATTAKQSRIAFKDISSMIKTASPSIKKRFKILQNEIRCLPNGGTIVPTSKQAESLDGLRVVTGILDEIHAHPDSSITDVIETGTRSSKDPIIFCISTAGTDTQSYGREVFEWSKEIATGIAKGNDRTFACVYTVNDEDAEDWENEANWERANPALGHAVSVGGLRAARDEAKRNAVARSNFMTKHLNVFVDFDEANFIDSADLERGKYNELNINDFKGMECYLGLDLAGVSDLSSLVYLFPTDDGGMTVFQKSYLPESAARDLKPSIHDRYYTAQQNGELVFTPSEVTDLDYIRADIENAFEDFNVQALSIDAASGGAQFANQLSEVGIDAVAVKQGYGLSESAVQVQRLLKSGLFKYDSDLLAWCFGNALVREGIKGEICVIRPKNDLTKKIDVCIATIIGMSQTILKENKTSIYETHDFRFL
ncbi:MAG: terminase large subunit [Aeromonas veronii]